MSGRNPGMVEGSRRKRRAIKRSSEALGSLQEPNDANITTVAPSLNKPQKLRRKRQKVGEHGSSLGGLQLGSQAESSVSSFFWNDYAACCALTDLEVSDLTGIEVTSLPSGPSLQARMSSTEHLWHAKEYPSQLQRPVALIVCPAAITCADAVRDMPKYNKECRIAKLFAKHFKVEEQEAYLAAHPLVMGVGTPNRLQKLTDLGALSLERLRLVVLDLRQDVKKRTLLDMKETRNDWWQFFKQHLHALVAGKGLQLAILKDTP